MSVSLTIFLSVRFFAPTCPLPEEGRQGGLGGERLEEESPLETVLLLSGRVGGEAVQIRGEYAAITVTLQQAQVNKPLAILLDCMSAIGG
eukprot:1041076-Rhodomonas_salina.1